MPQIPAEFIPSVQPEAGQPGSKPIDLSPNTIDKATPENFGSQVGNALSQTGDMLAQNAIQRQQLINEANVNDVYANQFSPKLQALRQNYMKLEGKDAEEQFPAYQAQVQGLLADTRASFPSPMAQKLFDEQSIRRTERELDVMSNYASTETKKYQLTAHTSAIDNLASDGAANYNQPQILLANQAEIDKQTVNFGATHGWSPDQIKDQMNKNQGKLWSAVIERQAVDNPVQAQRIFDVKTKDGTLDGNAQKELTLKLKPQMDLVQAQNAYGKVTGGVTAQQLDQIAQQRGADPATVNMIWSAEGHVSDPTVRNPTSSATGIGQFIDSTWAAMGGTDADRFDKQRQMELLVDHTKQNTAALTKDLGRQPQPWEVYVAHQQGIGGAEALLHADPNASAVSLLGGNPAVLTKNGIPADATAGQALSFLKAYAEKHAQMYGPGGMPSAQNLADNWESHMNQLADQAHQDNPNDPTLVDRYQKIYGMEAGKIIDAQKKTDDANRKVVNNALSGPQAFQSKDQFLADPVTKAAYDAIYEKDHRIADNVDDFFFKKNTGLWNPAPTPESDNLYGSLKGYARSDQRDTFASMDLHPYYGAMPENQYNDLVGLQQRIQDGDAKESQKSVKINTAVNNVQDLLNRAKNRDYKDQTPYAGLDKNGYGRRQDMFFRFQHDYENDLDAFETNNGRPPTYKEQRDLATQRLFPNGLTEAQPKQKPGAQPQIDFSKFSPGNQDDYSKWIVGQLQANGKLVNDDTITKAKGLIEAQHPGTEKQFRNTQASSEAR